MVTTFDNNLIQLRTAYQQVLDYSAPGNTFSEVVGKIDWDSQPAAVFEETISMAISLEAIKLARELAALGHERYPTNTVIERATRILAPPKIIDAHRPPKKGLSTAMEWLSEHSDEYRKQWVALRDGKLIGKAASYSALLDQIGSLATEPEVIVTRVP